jgi:Mce-associated membrane protein
MVDTEPLEIIDTDDDDEVPATKQPVSQVRSAAIIAVLTVVALALLTGWLGWRAYQTRQTEQQRSLFVEVARQSALNLTTIDWQHADADVKRILDSATGTFYDDFSQRSQPFIDVVRQAQTKSVGAIAESGLESDMPNQAKVLVAVTVKTSSAGAPEGEPRAWRMRITVDRLGDQAKVSKVEFVP